MKVFSSSLRNKGRSDVFPSNLFNFFGVFNVAIVLVLAAFLIPLSTEAAGLLIADGGLGGVLEVKEHEVQVTINNGIAVTRVTQVFHNTEKRQVEALYTFPVPKAPQSQ